MSCASSRGGHGDVCARIGGEGIALIPPERARPVCERIREAVVAEPVRVGLRQARVTVGIGVTAFDTGEEPDAVMVRADAALYRSKEAGRNRSSLAA